MLEALGTVNVILTHLVVSLKTLKGRSISKLL